MNVPATDVELSDAEFGTILVSAIVVAVMFGPGAVTVVGVDSVWVTAISVGLMGALAAVVGVLTLVVIRRVLGHRSG